MKIYGKSFKEIFSDVPWMYQVVLVVGAAFILFSIVNTVYVFYTFSERLAPQQEPPRVIAISGAGADGGLLDPAIASNGRIQAMAVTDMKQPDFVLPGNPKHLFNTIMAIGIDKCDKWAPVGAPVFKGASDVLVGPDSTTPFPAGTWRYETPGLAYDPDDKGREWKLFAYKYYSNNTPSLSPLYSAIVYKYAPDPHGPWSDEQWILSAAPDKPPQPYAGLVRQYISRMDPAVSNLYSFSRPSVVYSKGVLFMSLSAFQRGFSLPVGIILLASTDHGKSWQYINTLLTMKDAKDLGDYTIGGGSLFMHDGKMYMAVVFGDAASAGLGSFIIPVADPVKGQLERDEKTGLPVIANKLGLHTAAKNPRGGGYLAYTDDCKKAGVVESEYSGNFRKHVLFKTYLGPLQKIEKKN
ncbi:MAG: hypothetical protein GC185_07845 [Alphaproteobacteria bacterium]|nr:hypothetical protein [Alphaproteobacteria bacterium]